MPDTTTAAPGPGGCRRRSYATGRATRRLLIETAERLFAEHGINGVSREIRLAAGQSNTSAVTYHFGSKTGLLRAILEYRLEFVSARQKFLLDQMEAGCGRAGVR